MRMNIDPLAYPKGVPLAVSFLQKKLNQLKKIPLIVAIDGHSSSGKSTLARDLSSVLELKHLDSGAMYRAVTLYFLDNQIDHNNPEEVTSALADIRIDLKKMDGQMRTFLNGSDVEKEIRTPRIAAVVSEVSTISSVRRFLVDLQQKLGRNKSVVMDGRDIGTVVFPTAEIKFFLTASMDVRTRRRLEELKAKGLEVTIEEVRYNLQKRDKIDSSRKDSPLTQAKDAIVLDTSDLDRSGQLTKALEIMIKKLCSP